MAPETRRPAAAPDAPHAPDGAEAGPARDGSALAALAKLALWLSPAYPTGAFAYSHGLETAIEARDIRDAATLADWIGAAMTMGGPRSDAILLAAAWRAPGDAVLADLALALQPSRERRLETLALGRAFAEITAAAWPAPGLEPAEAEAASAYPIAVGRAARAHGCGLSETLLLYLQSVAAGLVSVGVRLVPVGQTAGQRVLAGLQPGLVALAGEAERATLDDLGGAALALDIASMLHETLPTRLFRS